jgi:hypothetical protein
MRQFVQLKMGALNIKDNMQEANKNLAVCLFGLFFGP